MHEIFSYLDLIQILERREVRRWKKALKAEPGLMLCGKRIVQHCDRFGHTCSSFYCFLLFLLLTLKLFSLLLMLISLVLRLPILCCVFTFVTVSFVVLILFVHGVITHISTGIHLLKYPIPAMETPA